MVYTKLKNSSKKRHLSYEERNKSKRRSYGCYGILLLFLGVATIVMDFSSLAMEQKAVAEWAQLDKFGQRTEVFVLDKTSGRG